LQLSESIEQWLISLLDFLDFPAGFDLIARHGDARSTELQSTPAARQSAATSTGHQRQAASVSITVSRSI
jgi:hypothetical protein